MAAEEATRGGALKFLKQKAGPLPVWVWLAAFAAIWWYYQRQNSGGSAAAAASGNTGVGYGIDAAGNSGYIDPETGYVYGSAEDIASLQQQGTLAGNTYSGGSSSSGTGGYADDAAWSEAAINYLVARGVDPATANQAITLYLAGQNLTAEQQADVNLAIQGIGAPPQLPGPSTGNPGPIQTPPSGGGSTSTGGGSGGGTKSGGGSTTKPKAKAPAMPTGVIAEGAGRTGFGVKWHKVATATEYVVRITYQDKLVKQVTTKNTVVGISGLSPNRTYTVHVKAGNSAGWSAETNGPAIKTTN